MLFSGTTAPVLSPVTVASSTGGAGIGRTYAWNMTPTNPGGRGHLYNPADSSSQRIEVDPPHAPIGEDVDFIVRATVTDALGHQATANYTFTARRILQPPSGPPD